MQRNKVKNSKENKLKKELINVLKKVKTILFCLINCRHCCVAVTFTRSIESR